jgi:biopolymer transport protein ExbB
MSGFISLIREGNFFMIVNLAVFVFALATIAERFFVVFFRLRISDRDFLEAVEKQLNAGNMDKAIKLTQLAPNAPLAKVTRAALSEVRHGPDAITAAIDEALLEITPMVKKRIEILWSLANVATLVGLIGTISGLIAAFKAIGGVDPEKKTALLTAGIAEAMHNTAFGLTIAVTCILAHMVLNGATKKITEGAEHGGLKIENVLRRLRAQQNMRDKAAAKP